MSWRRPFIWTCDYCQTSTEKEGYGFPPGFRFISATLKNPVPKHICKECFEKEVDSVKRAVSDARSR